MSVIIAQNLSGVAESLLIMLYIRALESQRPDGLIKDEQAVALARQMDQDFLRNKLARIDETTQVAIILRNRQFDCCARDFLVRCPEAVVVHIGCGFDSRFERVAERFGKVEWYDLDLPDVIELRRQLIGGEKERYHLLACSVLDRAWLDAVSTYRQRPFLFLAEGVLMYLTETQVKSLAFTLKKNFPGAELVFDAFSPFFVWANNRRVARTKIGALCHWALKRGKDLEQWSDDIRLIDEWFPFEQSEPRLGKARWVRHIPLFARTMGIFHYRIGTVVDSSLESGNS